MQFSDFAQIDELFEFVKVQRICIPKYYLSTTMLSYGVA
jgi:hypothetical protein